MKKILITLLTTFSVLFLSIFMPISANAQEPSNFDFETWYSDAKNAYDNFINVLTEKKEDATVAQIYSNADSLTRSSLTLKKDYVECVKNGTEEEWESFSDIELFAYKSTYLDFTSLMNKSNDFINDNIKSSDAKKEIYFQRNLGISEFMGESGNAIFSAYMNFADYQLQYFEYYNFPYNFHTDKSYAEETGIEITSETATTEETEDLESLGLTKDEIAEIESEIEAEIGTKQENIKNTNSNSINPIIIIIPIILIFAICGYVIFQKKE